MGAHLGDELLTSQLPDTGWIQIPRTMARFSASALFQNKSSSGKYCATDCCGSAPGNCAPASSSACATATGCANPAAADPADRNSGTCLGHQVRHVSRVLGVVFVPAAHRSGCGSSDRLIGRIDHQMALRNEMLRQRLVVDAGGLQSENHRLKTIPLHVKAHLAQQMPEALGAVLNDQPFEDRLALASPKSRGACVWRYPNHDQILSGSANLALELTELIDSVTLVSFMVTSS